LGKELIQQGLELPVMEMFYSLQGEGFHTGKPAFFIRIGGCDVGCFWCDVKESWRADWHPVMSVDKIIEEALKTPANAIVITGGEPLIYELSHLTKAFRALNFSIFLETSGTEPLRGEFSWICLSPKQQHKPLDIFYSKADELKVIIHQESDFEWAEANAELVKSSCQLFLQPEWRASKKMLPLIISYIKNNTKWRISLQTHKYLRIP